MEITEFSIPCSLTLAAYGYQLKLLSVVDGDGLLFSADLRKQDLQFDFNQLPENEKKGLTAEIDNIKNPNNPQENVNPRELQTLKDALNRVSLENFGIFWEQKTSRTLFYLEVKLDLSTTVSLFDGNFELDYLYLDLIIASGDKELTKEDRDRKEKIKQVRKSIWSASTKQSVLDELASGIRQSENSVNAAIEATKEVFTNGLSKQIEEATKKVNDFQSTVNKLFNEIGSRQEISKELQSQFQDIENRNEAKQQASRFATQLFNENPRDTFYERMAEQKATENFMQQQHQEALEQYERSNLFVETESIETKIDALIELHQDKISELKEIENFDFK